jgi:hypothetical protein
MSRANGTPEEPWVLMEDGRQPSEGRTSRMSREAHVRSREGLKVKLPRATRRKPESVHLTPSF